ncbi:hypothetical protein LQZ24_05440 [Fructobacillus sp. M1-13]|uniref:Uncharacterized protein n=1 Tax=Fructobacillus papyriferae TaxID=2713171 RepID=A0ABS5QRE4_9LACO|nr:hypothetical protein [Fructobacillus papyriferae]MBS9335075.1 hypothetical protein [Fructobacillus papyriferae]MCD2159439.1 hypothetical protein [Fructobacillus papyriferae]
MVKKAISIVLSFVLISTVFILKNINTTVLADDTLSPDEARRTLIHSLPVPAGVSKENFYYYANYANVISLPDQDIADDCLVFKDTQSNVLIGNTFHLLEKDSDGHVLRHLDVKDGQFHLTTVGELKTILETVKTNYPWLMNAQQNDDAS